MKNIFIFLFLWLLVGCQNIQNPPNISQNTESVARAETQNTENLKSVSQNDETTAQAKSQKEEETEDNSPQTNDDCVFSGNNFCFSEWKDYPKVDLGDGVFLELSEEYVSLYIGEEGVDSIHFRDFFRGMGGILWYGNMDFNKCEAELGKKETEDWRIEERCPQLFQETVKNAIKEKIFYRWKEEDLKDITNTVKDIAVVSIWVYEWPGRVYVFDIKKQKFLMTSTVNDLHYIYKTDDFVVIQEFPMVYSGESGLTFFFNNGSTIKIPNLAEGKMKSVKIDGNKVNFTFNCGISDEECKNQGNEIKITKTFEELFGLSEN